MNLALLKFIGPCMKHLSTSALIMYVTRLQLPGLPLGPFIILWDLGHLYTGLRCGWEIYLHCIQYVRIHEPSVTIAHVILINLTISHWPECSRSCVHGKCCSGYGLRKQASQNKRFSDTSEFFWSIPSFKMHYCATVGGHESALELQKHLVKRMTSAWGLANRYGNAFDKSHWHTQELSGNVQGEPISTICTIHRCLLLKSVVFIEFCTQALCSQSESTVKSSVILADSHRWT